jgi:predicted naringenin-chalcone synthase
LNLRIRLSYACAQLISLPFIGVRSAVSTNPLVFTGRYYQTENPDAAAKFPDGKTNFSSIIRTLKNTADVDGRTKVLAAYKPIKIRGYIWL